MGDTNPAFILESTVDDLDPSKELKRRGRPTHKKMVINDEEVALQTEDIVKKKRGRKPTGKIIDLNKVNIATEYTECIIAHLPLSTKDIQKITQVQAELPDKVTNVQNISLNIDDEGDVIHACRKCKDLEQKCSELQTQLANMQTQHGSQGAHGSQHPHAAHSTFTGRRIYKCEPDASSCCWWCCHTFDAVPTGLPERYFENDFYMHGHFCSFNCAHAYNINTNDLKIWERYALLNLFRKKIGMATDKRIMPAPPRQILKMFGGEMTIEQFRENNINLNKEYRHLLPPFIPINGVIEEVNKNVHKIHTSSNLKVKRTKPLPGINNNLFQLMKKT